MSDSINIHQKSYLRFSVLTRSLREFFGGTFFERPSPEQDKQFSKSGKPFALERGYISHLNYINRKGRSASGTTQNSEKVLRIERNCQTSAQTAAGIDRIVPIHANAIATQVDERNIAIKIARTGTEGPVGDV